MNTAKACLLGSLLCLLSGLPVLAGTPDAEKIGWPAHLRLLTSPPGGQWFVLGAPIAEALSKDVLSTSSRVGLGIANIQNVNRKKADLAFTLQCFLKAAHSGEAQYADIRADNAVLLANVYPQILYFLIRKDFAEKHGIGSVADLVRKKMPLRFASLKPGSTSEFILNLLFKFGYGTSFDKLRAQGWSIDFNNFAETADNFVAGELDCFAYTSGTNVPLFKRMETHSDFLILPVDQKVLDLLAKKFNTGTYVIKPGDYKNVTAPVTTLGDYACLVIRKDLPDNLVYALCESLWENKKAITEVIQDFGALSPQTAAPGGVPTHPGASAFWASSGKR